ncbi:MAG: rod shape-determining protein MreD [Sphingomonadaceae bacterium]|nr:rod shape-determining protein MreD [Sphingomonadaceae bacterium]
MPASRAQQNRANGPPLSWRLRLTPTISVLLASAVTLLPLAPGAPLLPPLGLMMLLAWRLLRSDIWPLWIGLPLGLVDDLMSGQPVGSAVFLWSAAILTLDFVDRRIVWRDFWQDWAIAAAMLAVALFVGGLLARSGGPLDLLRLLTPQWLLSLLLMPLAMRLVGSLDAWRRLR